MAHIDTAKQWFETGDLPTQEQFYWVFERLRWTDQPIPINNVTGLLQILNQLATPVEVFTTSGNLVYTLPAGFILEKIIVVPVSDCDVTVENNGTLDPGDIVKEVPVSASTGSVLAVDLLAVNASREINISGQPNGSTVTIIKRKITA